MPDDTNDDSQGSRCRPLSDSAPRDVRDLTTAAQACATRRWETVNGADEERLLRRRLLILRWAAETREEALRLASGLDANHAITQTLLDVANSCQRLTDLWSQPPASGG